MHSASTLVPVRAPPSRPHASLGGAARAGDGPRGAAGVAPRRGRRGARVRRAAAIRHRLFSIKGPDNAAAQEFTTDDSRVEKASLYLASRAASGTVTVEVRTAREDPGSAISSSTRDLAQLGGGGAGWLDFPLGADVTPGTTYYLFAQATTTESKAIAWLGTRSPVGGSLTSWNYDLPVLGGWRAYTTRTAFFLNPAGAEGCGDPDACYRAVPDHVFAASTAGLYSNGKTTEAITPVQAYGSEYVRDSNVLRLPSGRWRYLPAGGSEPVTVRANDPGARRQISESRAWLKRGTVNAGRDRNARPPHGPCSP